MINNSTIDLILKLKESKYKEFSALLESAVLIKNSGLEMEEAVETVRELKAVLNGEDTIAVTTTREE